MAIVHCINYAAAKRYFEELKKVIIYNKEWYKLIEQKQTPVLTEKCRDAGIKNVIR